MTVLRALEREHRLMTGLLGRLEEFCRSESAAAGLEIRQTLDLLFPALCQHEAIETEVFREARGNERAARDAIDSQHSDLHARQQDILAVLMAGRRCTDPEVKPLIETLCRDLREHFKVEESLLWPLAAQRIRALAGSSSEPERWERVRALISAIDRRADAIERAASSNTQEGL